MDNDFDYDNDGEQQPEKSDFAKSVTEGWKQDRRPDFLKETKGEAAKAGAAKVAGVPAGASGSLKAVGAASALGKDKGKDGGKGNESSNARDRFTNAERGAIGGGFYTGKGASDKGAREKEENPDGFSFTGKGLNKIKKGLGKHKIAKVSAGAVVALVLGVVGVGAAFIGGAQFTIGSLDFNMMDAFGYLGTVTILEKIAKNIIKEWLENGKLSDFLCDKLASQNFMVGQLTANGDFVRTNTYIADADKLKDLAVLGNFQVNDSLEKEGELAILYNGERVIAASDFLETLEDNPEIRAKLEVALELGALYYYGDDAKKVFQESGAKKDLFKGWEDQHDPNKNEIEFYDILKHGINGVSDLVLGMVYNAMGVDSDGNETSPEPTTNSVSGLTGGAFANGKEIVDAVNDNTKDDDSKKNATYKTGQLLTQAISSGEPYLGVASFMAVEEVIQRTRITPNETPVNELLNYMQRQKEIEFTNILTGEKVKTKDSILTTPNFAASVSNGRLSQEEAINFNRDRGVLGVRISELTDSENGEFLDSLSKDMVRIDDDTKKALKFGDVDDNSDYETDDKKNIKNIIKDTRIESSGKEDSKIALFTGENNDPNRNWLDRLEDSMQKSMIDPNTKILQSTYGGNRTTEGGAFLSNMINTYSSGAMWSDSDRIKEYHAEVKEELAKKAEAQRAIKSPFDITSPYTFLGSIAHSLSNAMIRNGIASKSGVGGSVIGTFADVTGDSIGELFADATADGNDYSYEMTHGDYCFTADSAARVKGDIYCNPKTTFITKYLKLKKKDWDTKIDKDYYKKEFVGYAMDRMPSVGILDTNICEKIRENSPDSIQDAVQTFIDKLAALITGDVYTACSGLSDSDLSKARGERFTLSKKNSKKGNVELYSAFALYDKVSAMLENRFSLAAEYRNEYYAEHPLDESRAGKISRISGLSKKEAEVAIAYADYLTYLALYNPAERYSFVTDWAAFIPSRPLVDHSNKVSGELYAVWHGRTVYDDLRGKIQVV